MAELPATPQLFSCATVQRGRHLDIQEVVSSSQVWVQDHVTAPNRSHRCTLRCSLVHITEVLACRIVKRKYFAIAAWVTVTPLSRTVDSQNPHFRYLHHETQPLGHQTLDNQILEGSF